MKLPIKTRLAIWLLQRRNQTLSPNQQLAFRATNEGIRRVLLILPENKNNLPTAVYFLKSILSRPTREIYLLGTNLTAVKEAGLQATEGFQYSTDDFNWLGLPSTHKLKEILQQRFDAVANLNADFTLSAAMLTLSVKTSLRLGFKGRHSAQIYNVEIDRRPEGFLERGYVTLQKILGL